MQAVHHNGCVSVLGEHIIYDIQFIHSLIDRHVYCFQFFATTSHAGKIPL